MRAHTDSQQSKNASEITFSTDSEGSDTVELYPENFTTVIAPLHADASQPDGEYVSEDGHYKFSYFKANPPELRKSYTLLTDLWRNKTSKLEDAGVLGTGSFSTARDFKDDTGHSIVSKKSHKPQGYQSKKEIQKLLGMIDREVYFARQLYPHENTFAKFTWITLNPNGTDEEYGVLESRVLVPKVKDGLTLFDYTMDCDNADDLALLVYYIMLEVESMHNQRCDNGVTGIVHGDLSSNNVMIRNFYDVYIIDPSFACFVGQMPYVFKMEDHKKSYIPKERTYKHKRNEATTVAETNQDVYTLAHNLKDAFDKNIKLSLRLALYNKFPDILNFISNSLVDDAAARPTLRDYIDRLRPQLKTQMLRKAVRILPDADFIKWLAQFGSQYSAAELHQVIFSFIEDENFKVAARLVDVFQNQFESYAKNSVAALLRMIPLIKVELENTENGVEHNDKREQLVSELCTALDFAKVVCNKVTSVPCSSTISAIRLHPRLHCLYRKMFESQHDLSRGNSFTSLHQRTPYK